MKHDPSQLDLFREPLFPVRIAVERIDLERYRARMKRAMARAIRECPHDRPTIVARMSAYLGTSISKASLDAWTAESKTGHDVTMPRFAAFVHATGALWLWDEAAAMQGVTMLIGDEARLAEIEARRQDLRQASAELKALMAAPITIRGRRR